LVGSFIGFLKTILEDTSPEVLIKQRNKQFFKNLIDFIVFGNDEIVKN
jgi:hypothetical protein